jgi:dTDP-4-amino-4,6-dideoxygalactose transaminase
MAMPAHLTRDLTEPPPIPEAGIARANELLRSGRLFRYGEMGADQLDASLLEREFAALVGREFCVAVNSGGSAIFLALKVAGVEPGDPVLVNGFTLAPVPGAIVHAGAHPVVVEIGPDFVIDPADLARKARASGARVLLLSHMRGHIADMDAVLAICAEHGIVLIEDCAHALGARYRGRAIGTFGIAGAFSAQTYKHLNSGEGGFLVLDDSALAALAILHSGSYMLHAQHLCSPGPGPLKVAAGEAANFSLRMTALAAALLRPQLAELAGRVARWRVIHDRIAAGLSDVRGLRLPGRVRGADPAPTSIQFSLPDLSPPGMIEFLDRALSRGLPIKWFGAPDPVGFTSAPRHWAHAGPREPLVATHTILATLCDIRTPLSLTDSECDLIAEIVRDAVAATEVGANSAGARHRIVELRPGRRQAPGS